MEQKLFDHGWIKMPDGSYEHGDGRRLIHQASRWYLVLPKGKRREFKSLKDFIARMINDQVGVG